MIDPSTCPHPEAAVRPGIRSPLRYGSAPTEVCSDCGSYRLTGRWATAWMPGPMPTADEDE